MPPLPLRPRVQPITGWGSRRQPQRALPRQIVTLHRIRQDADGTFGYLRYLGEIVAATCEDPWNGNARNISCIPASTYRCLPHSGPKFKDVWEVTGVPGRSAILIHNGNTEDDTQGCILVGKQFGRLGGKPAVTESRATLDKLRATLPEEFDLQIVENFEANHGA